ncbi:hypothetical protein L596_010221 [Steinernema carpocapsae]|uniref:Uncharacterized protein n=1 Tax=Steinernema carpocapsae TaxID=34508 RepID=A0A4U5PHZ1_STECR|nr:hypothetical protein L596_010221 [Steinernema carpocapsae]
MTVEMQATNVATDEICSLTLTSTFWVNNMTVLIWSASAFLATLCSVSVLYSVAHMKAAYTTNESRVKIQMDKRIAWAVFLQSILPALISIPLLSLTVLTEYEIGKELPEWIYWLSNASVFMYFAVSPIISLIVIKQYRMATKQFLIRLLRKAGFFVKPKKKMFAVSVSKIPKPNEHLKVADASRIE